MVAHRLPEMKRGESLLQIMKGKKDKLSCNGLGTGSLRRRIVRWAREENVIRKVRVLGVSYPRGRQWEKDGREKVPDRASV